MNDATSARASRDSSPRRIHHTSPAAAEPGPRKQSITELPDVEAEAHVVAHVRVVHVDERALVHVVEQQPIDERRAVPHVHRDVPREHDARDEPAACSVARAARDLASAWSRRCRRAPRKPAAPSRARPWPSRDRDEQPGGEKQEPLHTTLAPVENDEHAGDDCPDQPPTARAAVWRLTACCVRHASLPGSPQLPPPEPRRTRPGAAETRGRRFDLQRQVARQQIEDLRQHEQRESREQEVKSR